MWLSYVCFQFLILLHLQSRPLTLAGNMANGETDNLGDILESCDVYPP